MLFTIISSAILLLLTVLSVSWHLKVLFLYLLFLTLKTYLPIYSNSKGLINWGLSFLFLVSFWFAFPDKTSDKDDYIQSVYFHKTTKEIMSAPLLTYLTNIVGEGDIMEVVTIAAKIIPVKYLGKGWGHAIQNTLAYMNRTPYSKNNFVLPYRELAHENTPPHNVPFQILKGNGWYKDMDHYFLHIPEGKEIEEYEVIVFCHGYTGNWLLYSTLFSQYTDAIVIAVETPDFNGHFTNDIMHNIIENTIPHAFNRMGIANKKLI